MPELHVVAERPEPADQLPFGEGWPQFIFHDSVAKEYLDRVDEDDRREYGEPGVWMSHREP